MALAAAGVPSGWTSRANSNAMLTTAAEGRSPSRPLGPGLRCWRRPVVLRVGGPVHDLVAVAVVLDEGADERGDRQGHESPIGPNSAAPEAEPKARPAFSSIVLALILGLSQ